MSYSKKETLLLKSLLLHFHCDLTLKDYQWTSLYFYLFDDACLPAFIKDKNVLETLDYLRDIITSNSFDTMRELLAFYEAKKLKLKAFIHTMFTEKVGEINEKAAKEKS